MRIAPAKVVVFAALMFTVCGPALAATNPERVAVSALLDRFETVFYSKSEIVSMSGAYDRSSKLESSAFRQPFALFHGALHSLGEWPADEILKGSEAVLVGAKDFRAPEGSEHLGQVRSQFCYIVILKSTSGIKAQKYFSTSEPPSGSAAGSPVWHWSAKLNEFGRDDPRPSSLYLTEVSTKYLLISNELEDLRDLAARLASSDQDLETLGALWDWSSVRDHQFWGYRKYRHSGVLDEVAAGTSEVTPSAKALTFFLDFDKRIGVLRMFCSAADDSPTVKIDARAALPRFRQAGPGVWETRTQLTGNEDSAGRMFVVMYLFGFGIYL